MSDHNLITTVIAAVIDHTNCTYFTTINIALALWPCRQGISLARRIGQDFKIFAFLSRSKSVVRSIQNFGQLFIRDGLNGVQRYLLIVDRVQDLLKIGQVKLQISLLDVLEFLCKLDVNKYPANTGRSPYDYE